MRAVTCRGGRGREAEDAPTGAIGEVKVDLVKWTTPPPTGRCWPTWLQGDSRRFSAVHLTPTEWHLLEVLVRHPSKLLCASASCSPEVVGVGIRQPAGQLAPLHDPVAAQAGAGTGPTALPADRARHGLPLPARPPPHLRTRCPTVNGVDLLRTIARLMLGDVPRVQPAPGILTFARAQFQAQVPPWLPLDPDLVVLASGVLEITLGLALVLARRWRGRVGWVVAAFFVAVFPGNLAQWAEGRDAFGLDSDAARATRLLFQPALVAWALWSTGAWPGLAVRTTRPDRQWTRMSRHQDQRHPGARRQRCSGLARRVRRSRRCGRRAAGLRGLRAAATHRRPSGLAGPAR